MRIAVVHSRYRSEEPSGENSVVDDQVAALADAGFDVRLFERSSDELSGGRGYAMSSAWRAMTGVGASPDLHTTGWRADVVHVHNTFPNWGTRWLRQWGARTVVTLHNYRTVCAAATLFRDGSPCQDCLTLPVLPAIRHACYRGSGTQSIPLAIASAPAGGLRILPQRASKVLVLNHEAQELFQRVFERDVDLVPNFVEPADALPWSSPERRSWTYVGRLTAEKGISELVDSWPTRDSLDIYGAGPLESLLEKTVSQRPEQIRMHGLVPRSRLRRELAKSRGLIIPSLWTEGLPTVALEALSAGVPLAISDRVAAARELREAGVATTFDVRAPDSLTHALRQLSTIGETMSGRATTLFHDKYSRRAWLETITRIYEEVAGGPGPR